MEMIFDLHIHTSRFSGCSNIDPLTVLEKAAQAGMDGVALTEHGIRWPDEEIEKLISACRHTGLVVLPGEEAACYSKLGEFQGEFLVFGYPKSLGSALPVDELVKRVHGAGGVVVAAHPFKKARTGSSYYGCGHMAGSLNLDGMETRHPSYDAHARQEADLLAEASGIAAIGGSDAHLSGDIGKVATVFTRPVRNLEDLCREIRARRVGIREII